MFHAAGGVIKRDLLQFGMIAKKNAALVQGNRMRQHPAKLRELHLRRRDQVVPDAERVFALDEERMLEQKIEVFGHRTG